MPSRFHFVCLAVLDDARLEPIALLLQKQLAEIGVDMEVVQLPLRQVVKRVIAGDYDAVLTEFGSTRSLSFVYGIWHSPTPDFTPNFDTKGYRSADAALDQLRAAVTPEQIRPAVAAVQRVIYDDPPAVFIEWSQTTRAVSSDIAVPAEEGRDILGTIQRWKPASRTVASRQ